MPSWSRVTPCPEHPASNWPCPAAVLLSYAITYIPVFSWTIRTSGLCHCAEYLRRRRIKIAGMGSVSCCYRKPLRLSEEATWSESRRKSSRATVSNELLLNHWEVEASMAIDTRIVIALAALTGSFVGACSSVAVTFVGHPGYAVIPRDDPNRALSRTRDKNSMDRPVRWRARLFPRAGSREWAQTPPLPAQCLRICRP